MDIAHRSVFPFGSTAAEGYRISAAWAGTVSEKWQARCDVNAIELYRELIRALGLDRAPHPDLELVAVAGLYILAIVWLGRLWFARRNVRRRRQLARGLAVMDGVAALLRVIVLLAVGVLLALARAAGRPPYNRW